MNPGGRPRRGQSLAEHVRRAVDPAELVEFMLAVVRDVDARLSDRLAAANAIADRGWGKPLQPSELEISTRPSASLPSTWDSLEPAQRLAWIDSERRRLGAGS